MARRKGWWLALDEQPRRRILVVDDDTEITRTLREALDLIGEYHVAVADNGVAGLEQASEITPDCIILDVRMPGLNGYQIVRALRGDPATRAIPIVLLSALVQDRQQLAGLLTGADAYLVKPVAMDDLLRAVEEALSLSERERQTRGSFLAGDATPREGGTA